MRPHDAYRELLRLGREEWLLSSCAALLDWDELTCMREAAVESRAEQRSCLAGALHEKAVDPRRGELLSQVEDSELMGDADAPTAVNVREWRRQWNRHVRVPRSLVEEITRATSRGQHRWAVALQKRNFGLFRKALEQIVSLKRTEAECLGSPHPRQTSEVSKTSEVLGGIHAKKRCQKPFPAATPKNRFLTPFLGRMPPLS
jgi:carboxypeptidase Taq